MDPITIISDEPVPRSVEQAIRGLLGSYPGTWLLQVNQGLAGGWWSVKVTTEGFQNIFLIRPDERTADGIVRQLREALRGSQAPPPSWDGTERRSRPRS
jgi:hypothetical protein